MKNLFVVLLCAMACGPAGATTLQGGATTSDAETSGRATPFVAINFGGRMIKLGQQNFPSFENCAFYCLGERIYVYEEETLLGIIDKNFGFHCADKLLISWIVPRPESAYAASKAEVGYICSKVFCDPTDLVR